MKNQFFLIGLVLLVCTSCQKNVNVTTEVIAPKDTTSVISGTVYTIFEGQQYCDKNNYIPVNLTELKFKVKFDSSSIYKTVLTTNQADINKLYGFSDNNALHHDYSARFGWRWYNNALEIFAYNYNNGLVSFQKIGNAKIGIEETYSIKVLAESYVFTFGETILNMPRSSKTLTGVGYKLFPYFGGTETAPHTIKIWIQEL